MNLRKVQRDYYRDHTITPNLVWDPAKNPEDAQHMEKDLALLPPVITMFPADEGLLARKLQRQITYSTSAVTKGGKLLFSYFSGGSHGDEDAGNYIMIISSDDGGKTNRYWMAIEASRPDILRIFDTTLWIDDTDRLWIFWTQTYGDWDGRGGVWEMHCDDPDAENPVFTEPRRIAEGIIKSRITILSNGDWIFPVAKWDDRAAAECNMRCYYLNCDPEEQGVSIYRSQDRGETFQRIATHIHYPFSYFDEPDLVELSDGRLWMLIRGLNNYGHCFSEDGGVTWTTPRQNVKMNFPNSRFSFGKLKSGNLLLLANYKADMFSYFGGRNNLSALLSRDDGQTWEGVLLLDEREGVEQPWFQELDDGRIHISYGRAPQFAGEVLMAEVTEEDILAGKLVDPRSRLKVSITKAGGIQYREDYEQWCEFARQKNIEM